MDVVFDWNLGNMIYNGHNTLRLCGFPFAEIRSFHHFGGGRSCTGAIVSKAEEKRLAVEGSKATISLEEGVGSSPTAHPHSLR